MTYRNPQLLNWQELSLRGATAAEHTHVAIDPLAQSSLPYSVIPLQVHSKLLSISRWQYSLSQNAKRLLKPPRAGGVRWVKGAAIPPLIAWQVALPRIASSSVGPALAAGHFPPHFASHFHFGCQPGQRVEEASPAGHSIANSIGSGHPKCSSSCCPNG